MSIVVETERLRLRRWQHGDKGKFHEHCNTDAVMAFLGGRQTRKALAEDVDWFMACDEEFGHTLWVVERKSDDAFLGFCGIDHLRYGIPKHLRDEKEVGWRLREDAWGQGYASESAPIVMEIAFRIRRLKKVISRVASDNAASIRIMEQIGLKRAPDLEKNMEGELVYAATREEWLGWMINK